MKAAVMMKTALLGRQNIAVEQLHFETDLNRHVTGWKTADGTKTSQDVHTTNTPTKNVVLKKEQFRHHIPARTGSEVEAEDVDGATSEDTGCLGLTFLVSEISCSRSRMSTMFGRSSGCIFNIKPSTNSEHLKPGTHWQQSWIQCSRLLKVNHVALVPYTLATKSAVSATKLHASATKSTVSATVDFVADLLSVSATVDFHTKSTVLNSTFSPVCNGLNYTSTAIFVNL